MHLFCFWNALDLVAQHLLWSLESKISSMTSPAATCIGRSSHFVSICLPRATSLIVFQSFKEGVPKISKISSMTLPTEPEDGCDANSCSAAPLSVSQTHHVSSRDGRDWVAHDELSLGSRKRVAPVDAKHCTPGNHEGHERDLRHCKHCGTTFVRRASCPIYQTYTT